jgi:thioredoxin-related protein
MIIIDKGTDYKLLIITSPNCAVCREIQKSNKCEEIPLTRKLVLAPFSPTDELALQTIFKTQNPLETYNTLLNGKPINPSQIDWNKDIEKVWSENIKMFDYITKTFDIKGTPSFFILDKNDQVIKQITLDMQPAEVLMFNISEFIQ